ncbi:MAG TPA: Holliday junction resolvase RuvX [Verrucomicrobiae bacterium]|nr:Holliday junction resolvase RuvX [Verrucomicrobiae bacterium]
MRVLAIDFGLKRVGLAISDETGTVAQPLRYLEGGSDESVGRAVAQTAAGRGASKIVVGIPVRMSGQASQQTERTLRFFAALCRLTTLPVERWDERLTTAQAHRALLEGNVRRKTRQQKIDSMSAQIMLQSYLDAHNPPQQSED